MKIRKQTKANWDWSEGKTNTEHERFEIRYGSIGANSPGIFPLARS